MGKQFTTVKKKQNPVTKDATKAIESKQEAIVDKLVQEPDVRNKTIYKNIQNYLMDFKRIQDRLRERNQNNKHILTMFPDVELPIMILTTLVMSPNENSNQIRFTYESSLDIQSTIKYKLLNFVRDYITTNYDLEIDIVKIFKEACMTKGAHIEAVIPEVLVSDVIHNKLDYFAESKNTDGLSTTDKIIADAVNTFTSRCKAFFTESKQESNTLLSKRMQDEQKISKFKNNMVEAIKSSFSLGTDLKQIAHNRLVAERFLTKGKRVNLLGFYNSSIVQNEDGTTTLESNEVESIFLESGDGKEVFTESFQGVTMELPEKNHKIYEADEYMATNKGKADFINTKPEKYFKKIHPSDMNYNHVPSITLKDKSRKSFGKPMVMQLNNDAVIPIIYAGQPDKHLGYFVLIDENGLPLEYTDALDMNRMLQYEMGGGSFEDDMNANITRKAKLALMGSVDVDVGFKEMEMLYSNIVDKIIKDRLETSGLESINFAVDHNDIYKVMFNRALHGRLTRLIFVPKDFISYFAYDYRADGTGKSLLEKSSFLFSLRAVLTFVEIMSKIRSAVPTTEINVSFTEESDEIMADIESAIEDIKSRIIGMREAQNVIGELNVVNLSNWINTTGYRFNFDGVDGLPHVTVEGSTEGVAQAYLDDELVERIKSETITALGLTQDLVDAGTQVEFAVVNLNNNKLLRQRTLEYQRVTNKHLTDHIKRLLINDGMFIEKFIRILKDAEERYKEKEKLTQEERNIDTELFFRFQDILDAVKDNNKDDNPIEVSEDGKYVKVKGGKDTIYQYFVQEFLDSLLVTIPEPSKNTDTELFESINTTISNVEEIIEKLVSSEIFDDELMGDNSSKLEKIKHLGVHEEVLKLCKQYGVLERITDLFVQDEKGDIKSPLIREFTSKLMVLSKAMNEEYTVVRSVGEKIKTQVESKTSELEHIASTLEQSLEKEKEKQDMKYGEGTADLSGGDSSSQDVQDTDNKDEPADDKQDEKNDNKDEPEPDDAHDGDDEMKF